MANFITKLLRGFSVATQEDIQKDIIAQDKATLAGVPSTKGTGNPNPTPVTSKAVHAGMVYNPSLATKNGEEMYTPAEYNLSTVANCLDTDSYFRRAVEKYVELIWKAGYGFIGKNPNAVSYIRKRFEQIAMVTDNPTDQLFRDMSYQLVEFSNVYVSKVRSNKSSGGKPRVDFTGQEFQPVAGYFIEDSVSMYLSVKMNGDPIGYKQMMRGVYAMWGSNTGGTPVGNKNTGGENSNYYKIWKPWNMIHMVHSRKPGMRVGTPMVWPVMDDIRALRRIEQNVELLVFQHTIPLFQYVVGTDARPAQPDEIAAIKMVVERMPPNGCLVTPERHAIKAVGVEGSLIDASIYLEYYKNRVLSGLGMSGVGMGEGGTSNKGTAVVLDKHLVNTAGMYQQILKMYIDEYMIKELLAEGGFDVSYINEDNKVGIHFPPIDTEEQRAKENHYAQMYTQYAIDEDEMRREFGREPMKDEQRHRDYFELVTKPLEMIKAKLAQETAIVAGQAKPVVTKTASGASKIDRPKNVGQAKEMPTNQHGTLSAKPRIPKNDEIEQILNVFKDTKNDLIDSCIDSFKDDINIDVKLPNIRKLNFNNSKAILESKKLNSSLSDKDIIYNTALRTLDDIYDRFQTIKDMKHVDQLAVKIDSLFKTLSTRLEVHMLNNYEADITNLNSDS